QAPVQATLQQTPSAQKLDWHWLLFSQATPRGLLAAQAMPAQQTPPWQVPVAHSMSQAQLSPAALRGIGGVLGQAGVGSMPPGGVLAIVPPSRGPVVPPSGRIPITVVVTGLVPQPEASSAPARHRLVTTAKLRMATPRSHGERAGRARPTRPPLCGS